MDNKKKNIILLVCALIITVVYICTMPFWCGNGIVTALIYLATLAIYKRIPKAVGIIVAIAVIFFFGFGVFLAHPEQFFAGLIDFILLLWIITLIKNIIKKDNNAQ